MIADTTGESARREEWRAVSDFLERSSVEPCALVIEGDAGIGKTTFWLAACERARKAGFRVLSARPAAVEAVMAFAVVADLLAGIEPRVWADLPPPQRLAMDRITLRSTDDSAATDQRTAAAALLAVIEGLAEHQKVLLAIDDWQWLDQSSAAVFAFAIRRLSGPVGVMATVRTERAGSGAGSMELPNPDATQLIRLPPLRLGALHDVVSRRLGRSFSRPAMVRIHDVSGGNPLYAIELARTLGNDTATADIGLPATLSELVRARLVALGGDVQDMLLAAACLGKPTVELLAAALAIAPEAVSQLLEEAETAGIIILDGHQVRFSHPLLARGVSANSSAASRRAMHRRLADVVDQPELRARHMALGTTFADPDTLRALDDAAQMARRRGAPTAAAELLDLAINLGGDEPERLIRSAAYHFESGDPVRARSLLESTIKRLKPGQLRATAASVLATIVMYADGFGSAAGLLERFLPEAVAGTPSSIEMRMALAYVLINIGRKRDSLQYIDEAVAQAEQLEEPTLLSRALGLRVVLQFMAGASVDEENLGRAMALDDDRTPGPVAFQPRVHHALLMAWTGELGVAREQLRLIEHRRIDNGEESESVFISFHRAMVEIWSGDFAEADRIATQMMDRAGHLDGDVHLFSAMTIRSALDAYAGMAEEARRTAQVALDASNRSEGRELRGWLLANIGFLEVSLGNYRSALTLLQPVVDSLFSDPDYSEIIVASCVSDAVEAMIHVNRLDDAQRLTELVERNAIRLDRAWMLAVGGRCRGMLLAALGDLAGAASAAETAMQQHDRVPMPFERARTLLLLGQLQRRQRKKETSVTTIREALAVFEKLGTPIWADRARAELDRSSVGRKRGAGLTPSEQRVAELAASGMTTRDVAATLFMSPKTVEANLGRIYRKLGIRSRVELGQHLRSPDMPPFNQ